MKCNSRVSSIRERPQREIIWQDFHLSLIAAGDSGGSGVDHSPIDADVAKGLNPGASTNT